MRVVIKKADQADGQNIPIASRYSFQISASLPPKKPRGGILRRRKPSNILAADRFGFGGARPVPVSVLTQTLGWPGDPYQKLLGAEEFSDAEQWIEPVDNRGTSYYKGHEKTFLGETTVEEIPPQEVADGITTYMCSTCNFGSTDFNDFSAHSCTPDDPIGVQEMRQSGGKEKGDDKRVRKVEPIERAIAEILMNIESYDNAGQQGVDTVGMQGDEEGSQGEEEVVMEYVETPQQGDDSQQEYELRSFIQNQGEEEASLQVFVTDVPEVSENTTVIASPAKKAEKRRSSFPPYSGETRSCIITLHPQTYGDVKLEFTCEQCQSQYPHMNAYALHIFKIHRAKVCYDFMCENCHTMFNGFRFLIEHVTEGACIGEKPVARYQPCDRCPMKFRTVDILRSHMVSVHSVDCLWHCDECSLEFSSQLNFDAHDCGSAMQKRRRNDYRCKVCPKCFPSRNALNYHYKITHYESYLRRKSFAMQFARRGFGKENRTGVGYYILPEPIPGPKEGRGSKSVVKGVISDTITDKQCAKCDLQFDSSADLNRHFDNDHDDSGEFECAFCGEEFTTRTEMRMHIDFEHGFKTYSPVEPKETVQAESRKGKMPHPAAKLSAKLMSEVRTLVFKNPKKKTCDICSVNVRTNVDLLDHMLLHDVEDIKEIIASRNGRMATCKFCNKAFPGKVTPHACRKVKCPYCRGWFAGQQYLTKHIKTLHSVGEDESTKKTETRYGSTYPTPAKHMQRSVSLPTESESETEQVVDKKEQLEAPPEPEPPQEFDNTKNNTEVDESDVELKMAELFSDETPEIATSNHKEESKAVTEKTPLELKDVMQTCGISVEVENLPPEEGDITSVEDEIQPKIVYVNEAGEVIPDSEIHFVDENDPEYECEQGFEGSAVPQYDGNVASDLQEESDSKIYIIPDESAGQATEGYTQENLGYIEGLEGVGQRDVVYLVNEQNEVLGFQCQLCGVAFESQEEWTKHEEMHQLMEGSLSMEENTLV